MILAIHLNPILTKRLETGEQGCSPAHQNLAKMTMSQQAKGHVLSIMALLSLKLVPSVPLSALTCLCPKAGSTITLLFMLILRKSGSTKKLM